MEGVETGQLIGGFWTSTERRFSVINPYRREVVAEVCQAGPDEVHAVLAAASPPGQTPYERSEVLLRVRDRIAARDQDIIRVMVAESGFTVKDASGEVTRCLQTLTLCAEEAKRLAGDVVPFSGAPGGANRLGWTRLEPLGIVVAITPFNSPLNTVAHKVGPAFAAGNAVVLKPAEKTPLTAAMLCAAFVEAGAPAGSISLLQGKGSELGPALLDDPRPAFYAFTGSTAVGRKIHAGAGLRKTQMELGSIAATIVLSDADLDLA
ncbi:MAG TPA: aldehyde dehydrogenase family protein, partial [Kiloniellaceae bacterium]|nr:aldehyde dehydrogenase family protein [Kiloniellaceae bacterium]